VCLQRGVVLPMLTDGATNVTAGSRVTISAATAGTVKLATSGGIGLCLSGPGAAAGIALVLFTGAAPVSGVGTFLPLAGGTMAGNITMPAGGKLQSPDGLEYFSMNNGTTLYNGFGIRPTGSATTRLGYGGYSFRWIEGARYCTDAATALPIVSNLIQPNKRQHKIGAGLIKNIDSGAGVGINVNEELILLATDAAGFTWDATGNIALAGSCAQHSFAYFIYDVTDVKWYPKS
jgi:hypothetical protein